MPRLSLVVPSKAVGLSSPASRTTSLGVTAAVSPVEREHSAPDCRETGVVSSQQRLEAELRDSVTQSSSDVEPVHSQQVPACRADDPRKFTTCSAVSTMVHTSHHEAMEEEEGDDLSRPEVGAELAQVEELVDCIKSWEGPPELGDCSTGETKLEVTRLLKVPSNEAANGFVPQSPELVRDVMQKEPILDLSLPSYVPLRRYSRSPSPAQAAVSPRESDPLLTPVRSEATFHMSPNSIVNEYESDPPVATSPGRGQASTPSPSGPKRRRTEPAGSAGDPAFFTPPPPPLPMPDLSHLFRDENTRDTSRRRISEKSLFSSSFSDTLDMVGAGEAGRQARTDSRDISDLPEEEEEILLSVFCGRETFGAATFNTFTRKMELLKDLPLNPPDYELLVSLVFQVSLT